MKTVMFGCLTTLLTTQQAFNDLNITLKCFEEIDMLSRMLKDESKLVYLCTRAAEAAVTKGRTSVLIQMFEASDRLHFKPEASHFRNFVYQALRNSNNRKRQKKFG